MTARARRATKLGGRKARAGGGRPTRLASLAVPRPPPRPKLAGDAAGQRWSVQVSLQGTHSFQSLAVLSTRPGVLEQISVECDGAPIAAIRIQRSDQQAWPPELSAPGGGIGSMTAGSFELVGVDRPPQFGGPLRVLSPTPFLLPFTAGFELMVVTDDPQSTAAYRCVLSAVGTFTG